MYYNTVEGENSGVKYESLIKSPKDGPAPLQTLICYLILSHRACSRVNDCPG